MHDDPPGGTFQCRAGNRNTTHELNMSTVIHTVLRLCLWTVGAVSYRECPIPVGSFHDVLMGF